MLPIKRHKIRIFKRLLNCHINARLYDTIFEVVFQDKNSLTGFMFRIPCPPPFCLSLLENGFIPLYVGG